MTAKKTTKPSPPFSLSELAPKAIPSAIAWMTSPNVAFSPASPPCFASSLSSSPDSVILECRRDALVSYGGLVLGNKVVLEFIRSADILESEARSDMWEF